MCRVCGRLSGKQRQMSCFSQGSTATLFSGEVGEFIFLGEIYSGFCTPNIVKIGSFFFAELFTK